MTFSLAFIAEGDANTTECWSGSGRAFVEALRAAGARVDIYDAELKSWPRAAAAALSYHPTKARWRQRYGLGGLPFRARSARANRVLNAADCKYDAIIQVGATFMVSSAARRKAPYVLYCDSNLAYASRGAPYSSASRLAPGELQAALQRERRVYDAVDRIWTMSKALAASFQDDFEQPREKITTIYAGANNSPQPVPAERTRSRILFVGKDHYRKGSDVLLRAFEIVRREIPEVELHMVGGMPVSAVGPGIVVHGIISRASVAGSRLFDHLFATSTIFCMPSRYEPFGIAFVEAMRAGLPCIGTRRWAMPEIIDDGQTGWLVTDGSVDDLARTLIIALRNPEECARRGALGRERSLAEFTWERAAARAIEDIRRIRETAGTSSIAAAS